MLADIVVTAVLCYIVIAGVDIHSLAELACGVTQSSISKYVNGLPWTARDKLKSLHHKLSVLSDFAFHFTYRFIRLLSGHVLAQNSAPLFLISPAVCHGTDVPSSHKKVIESIQMCFPLKDKTVQVRLGGL